MDSKDSKDSEKQTSHLSSHVPHSSWSEQHMSFSNSSADSTYSTAAAAAAAAAASGRVRLPFLPYSVASTSTRMSPSTSSFRIENPNFVSLYHSQLWQAALRQQQLQLISQIAAINPFVHNPDSLSPTLPTARTNHHHTRHQHQSILTPNPIEVAALRIASDDTLINSEQALSDQIPGTPETSSLEAYREYISKLIQLQTTPSSKQSISVNLDKETKFGIVRSTSTQSETSYSLSRSYSSAKSISAPPLETKSTYLKTSTRHKKNEPFPRQTDSTFSVPENEIIGDISPTGAAAAITPALKRSSRDSNQNGRDKMFTCKICKRSFGYKHVLQNHERTHTGEKPFECKVCYKRFTRDHHLKTHMRLHTGEKPYSCSHCERQFVQVANLRRHLRVHTGEKPYKCDLCDSCFSDSNQLKAHNLIHKGEKPFECDLCQTKFRRRHHLVNHACTKQEGVGSDQGTSLHSNLSLLPTGKASMAENKSEFDDENGRKTKEKQYTSVPTAKFVGRMPADSSTDFRFSTHKLSSDDERHTDKRRQPRKSKDPKRWAMAGSGPKADEVEDEEVGIEETEESNENFQTEPEDLSSARKKSKHGKEDMVINAKEIEAKLTSSPSVDSSLSPSSSSNTTLHHNDGSSKVMNPKGSEQVV